MNSIIQNLFASVLDGQLTPNSYLLCSGASIIAGVLLSIILAKFNSGKKYSFSFLCTLILLPLVVQTVIMLVNGNIGTGVAVAGAFSLVRFRSAPGSAKDIVIIFLAMAAGLSTGTGYIGVCALLILISAVLLFILYFFGKRIEGDEKDLRITIAEDINYEGVFDEIFKEYTTQYTIVRVKTSNMGSLFKLRYKIKMKPKKSEKEFIDALRTRNGNLEIALSTVVDDGDNL